MAYAASFIEWFAEEAKRVRGDVFAAPDRLRAHRGPQGADRGLRRHHAVELPGRDDHPQGCSRAGRRLHDGGQAGLADPADGAGSGRAGRPRRACRPACFNVVVGSAREIGAGADRQPAGPQGHLHRVDRGGSAAAGPVGGDDQEDLDGARRQRPDPGVRRRRPGRRRSPACSPPSSATPASPASAPTASTCRPASTTASPRSWRRGSPSSSSVTGFEPGASIGPLIDAAAVAKVEEHVADADRRRCAGAVRRSPGTSWAAQFFQPTVLADVAPGMLVTREETFGPVLPLIRFTDEADADPDGQRHRVRPGRLPVHPRRRAHLAGRRRARGGHGRDQHRPASPTRSPLRRHQAVGPRAGGLGLRHRRVPGDEVPRRGRAPGAP